MPNKLYPGQSRIETPEEERESSIVEENL